METSHDHIQRQFGLKHIVLVGAFAGVVFGIIYVAYNVYRERAQESKPWDSQAMVATFEGIEVRSSPLASVGFNYTLENKTDADRWFQTNRPDTPLMAKVRNRNSEQDTLVKVGSLYADFPNIIPAHGRARVRVYFSDDLLSSDLQERFAESNPLVASANPFDQLSLNPSNAVAARWANLNGFVLYDSQARYQINFPRGW